MCSLSDQSSESAQMLSERIQEALQVNVFNGPAQAKNSEDLQVSEYLKRLRDILHCGPGDELWGGRDHSGTSRYCGD